MEEEKEPYQKEVYTTFIFCNIMPIDDQHVWFIIDRRDVTLEFENIHEVAAYRSVLPLNLHGLNSITDSAEKLTAFCNANNEPIDVPQLPNLAQVDNELVKMRKIASPRTKESKNFLGNVKAILHMLYVEGRKPWEIGKVFCIRPEKIKHLIHQYVESAEEW
mgnify:FL=1